MRDSGTLATAGRSGYTGPPPSPSLPHYSVYLLEMTDRTVEALRAAKVVAHWPRLADGGTPGLRTLKPAAAETPVAGLTLKPTSLYTVMFLHAPDGDRTPRPWKNGRTAGISLRADRDANPEWRLRWYNGNAWAEFPWVVWLTALPRHQDREGPIY